MRWCSPGWAALECIAVRSFCAGRETVRGNGHLTPTERRKDHLTPTLSRAERGGRSRFTKKRLQMPQFRAIYRKKGAKGLSSVPVGGAEDRPFVPGFGPPSRVVPFLGVKISKSRRTERRRAQRRQSPRSICSDAAIKYSIARRFARKNFGTLDRERCSFIDRVPKIEIIKPDIVGAVASMTESDPGVQSEKVSLARGRIWLAFKVQFRQRSTNRSRFDLRPLICQRLAD